MLTLDELPARSSQHSGRNCRAPLRTQRTGRFPTTIIETADGSKPIYSVAAAASAEVAYGRGRVRKVRSQPATAPIRHDISHRSSRQRPTGITNRRGIQALPSLYPGRRLNSTQREEATARMGGGGGMSRWLNSSIRSRINVVNRAIGGRSSRTYITEGRWEETVRNSSSPETLSSSKMGTQ